jgi:hypothetical protein
MKSKVKRFGLKSAMRLTSLILVISFASPMFINAQSGKANFAGNWVMNAEKSPAPQGGGGMGPGRMGGGNFVATQDANLLTVVRTRTTPDGQEMTTTMKYTLDGKESVNASQRGDSKSVATWSADGKILTIATSRTMDMNGDSMTIKSSEKWTLVDANTLSIESTSSTPNGDMTSTVVYNKK